MNPDDFTEAFDDFAQRMEALQRGDGCACRWFPEVTHVPDLYGLLRLLCKNIGTTARGTDSLITMEEALMHALITSMAAGHAIGVARTADLAAKVPDYIPGVS